VHTRHTPTAGAVGEPLTSQYPHTSSSVTVRPTMRSPARHWRIKCIYLRFASSGEISPSQCRFSGESAHARSRKYRFILSSSVITATHRRPYRTDRPRDTHTDTGSRGRHSTCLLHRIRCTSHRAGHPQ
jgi:hypothetical protein